MEVEVTGFFLQLVILIASAKILGEICERLRFPSVIGYVLTGIAAGPMFLSIVKADEMFVFSELGVILLLFMTGFKEGNISEMLENKKTITTISLLGYAFPFITTLLIGLYVPQMLGMPALDLRHVLVLVLAVSATDIGVTVKTLADLRKLNTKIGRTMLGVTVMDGIVGLLIFTLALTYVRVGVVGYQEIVGVLLSIVAFFLVFLLLKWIAPRLVDRTERFTIEEGQFAFAFIFILLLAIIAESFGIDGIIGAFLAGIILSRSSIVETDFIEKLSAVSYAIFVPLFFVWTGLLLNVPSLSILSGIIIIGVLVSNFLGASLGSFLSGIRDKEDVISVGLGMLPRGGINLVIATIGIKLVSEEIGDLILATVMLLIITSIVVAPTLLRSVLKRERER
jgi:Kef-type K+ transport system membrane component KefB